MSGLEEDPMPAGGVIAGLAMFMTIVIFMSVAPLGVALATGYAIERVAGISRGTAAALALGSIGIVAVARVGADVRQLAHAIEQLLVTERRMSFDDHDENENEND